MESLKSFHDRLQNLESQGKKLIEARLALNTLFAGEETRLKREDQVSILRVVHRAIVEQLERIRFRESSASYGDTKVNLIFSLTGLVAKIFIAATTKNQRAWNIVNNAFNTEGYKKPFGTVMVCVGSKGLPDDIRVVSISQLARESHRPQPEIMNKLRDDGYLLFTEEAFSILIDRLIGDLSKGELHLPISRDKLIEIIEPYKQKLKVKIAEIE